DQLDAARLQVGQRAADILDLQAQVVDAGPALLQKAGHAAVCGGWLEQLDLAVAGREERDDDLLLRDVLDALQCQAEHIPVKGRGFVNVGDDGGDVIDAFDGHVILLANSSRPAGALWQMAYSSRPAGALWLMAYSLRPAGALWLMAYSPRPAGALWQ